MNKLVLICLPLLGAQFLLTGCGQKEVAEDKSVRSVRAMKVGDIEAWKGRSFPGRARAAQEVDLAFRVTGPLVTLPVKVGDEVEKGALIAQIDPRDFEVSLRNAEGGLQRAKATLNRAKLDYERMAGLKKKSPGAISDIDVDQAKESVEVANADIAAFEASVDAAKDALDYTRLRAPFAGTVVATYAENFENVRQQQMIVRIVDKAQLEFEVGIPETLISLISYIEDITVSFDAFPDVEIPAEVKEIGREASSTTRTFPVTVIMKQPEGVTVLPGMAGRAKGTFRPPDKDDRIQIVVPVTAVFTRGEEEESFVWIIDGDSNSVSSRSVDIGRLVSSGYVIDKGLKQGEMIATAGVHFLKEDQIVAPAIQ